MPVRGLSLLMIDDMWTTGARMQSAASALQLAGADAVAAVVLGRYVSPEYPIDHDLLGRAQATPFEFDRCCLETGQLDMSRLF